MSISDDRERLLELSKQRKLLEGKVSSALKSLASEECGSVGMNGLLTDSDGFPLSLDLHEIRSLRALVRESEYEIKTLEEKMRGGLEALHSRVRNERYYLRLDYCTRK